MAKKRPAKKRLRRGEDNTKLKTEAIERLEKLATDLADVTAEASAVAEIVREGLAAEESTRSEPSGSSKHRKPKSGAS
jgi:hypothetical protein